MNRRLALHFVALASFGLLTSAAFGDENRAEAARDGRYDIRSFGAKGDRAANDAPAIQAAIDACHKAGGGTVVVPPGGYLSGTFVLRSHVTLELTNGATIYSSKEKSHYPQPIGTRPVLVTAEDAENIAIVGEGVIDGQAPEDYGKRYGAREDYPFRRHTIRLINCRHVALRDFTIRYSDGFTCHLITCDGVFISGLTINNNVRHINSDGIDASGCRNVHTPDSYDTRSKPIGGERTTKDDRDTEFVRQPTYMALAHINGLRLCNIRVIQDEEARKKFARSGFEVFESRDVTIDGKTEEMP